MLLGTNGIVLCMCTLPRMLYVKGYNRVSYRQAVFCLSSLFESDHLLSDVIEIKYSKLLTKHSKPLVNALWLIGAYILFEHQNKLIY